MHAEMKEETYHIDKIPNYEQPKHVSNKDHKFCLECFIYLNIKADDGDSIK